jgi:hypothetical protein
MVKMIVGMNCSEETVESLTRTHKGGGSYGSPAGF